MAKLAKKNAIGGYFELELQNGCSFHKEKIALNSGRNALKYILREHCPRLLVLPRYTCEAIMQPILELKIPHAFYEINESLEPMGLDKFDADNTVLYINYFGLKDSAVRDLAKNTKKLIVDNTQAFFSPAVHGEPTFYSARKFFGVPDGAYAGGCSDSTENVEIDQSYERCTHLLKRIDLGAEEGFLDYQSNEKMIASLPLRRMSRVTSNILSSIDYSSVAEVRRKNYKSLHLRLGSCNCAVFADMGEECVPMAYPFLCDRSSLVREALLRNRVYCAQLWPNVLENLADQPTCIEYKMAANIIPLPIDQRYTEQQMQDVASIILEALHHG